MSPVATSFGFERGQGVKRMKFLMYRDVQGFWRWHLRAANGRKIADSGEGYHNRNDCRYAIDLVMEARSAPVVEG